MVMIFAIGVGIFAFIMNELKDTIGLLENIDADLHDYDNLNKFI